MRGRGDEFDMLQQAQRDVVEARLEAEDNMDKLAEAKEALAIIGEEKMRLLREMAQMRTGKMSVVKDEVDEVAVVMGADSSKRLQPGEAMVAQVGSLRIYEILMGLLFISVMISWNFLPEASS